MTGRPVTSATAAGRGSIAYVPQHPQLPAAMTGLDYVLLGRTPHQGYFAVESDADRRICLDLLDQMALGTWPAARSRRCLAERRNDSSWPVRSLSRLRSFCSTSRPARWTWAAGSTRSSWSTSLRRERSLTVLSAIHDLTLAGQFADRLVLLSGGRVAAAGTPAAVLRDDLLSETFGAGVGVMRTPDGDLAVISHRQRRAPSP